MAEHSNSKKKVIVVWLLLFLIGGGGIFLFFIIQGANDLTGAGKTNFTYSAAARDGVSSFFKYIGVSPSDEDDLAKSAKARMKKRGFDEDGSKPGSADVTDWMASNPSGGKGGGSSARPGAPTVVPHMNGQALSGAGGIGSGSTNSSSRLARFGGGDGSGDASIKNGQALPKNQGGKSSTLNALSNARAMLGAGLTSGSAMTAKGKWDASFGVGNAGRGGAELAYGKSGLVNLDKIKTGEVDNLKTTDPKSLDTPVPKMEVDKDAESKDPTLQKAKDDMEAELKKSMAQAAAQAAANAVSGDSTSGTAGGGDTARGADGQPQPPDAIKNFATQTQDKGGVFCPDGCQNAQGSFKDNPPPGNPTYVQVGSGWQISYSGVQQVNGGAPISYVDTISVDANGGNPTYMGSNENGKVIPP
jgi:hypothetical protein